MMKLTQESGNYNRPPRLFQEYQKPDQTIEFKGLLKHAESSDTTPRW